MTIIEPQDAAHQVLQDAIEMCPCLVPDVHERTCRRCHKLNLQALLEWHWCSCGSDADRTVHGLPARNCGLCGGYLGS